MSQNRQTVHKDSSHENKNGTADSMSFENHRRNKPSILLSACLAGMNCRFDGKIKLVERFKRLVDEGFAITICPEIAGGMSAPRPPSEIIGGTGEELLRCNGILTESGEINRDRLRPELFPVDEDCCSDGKTKIINKTGKDVTNYYIRGAMETLKTAEKQGIRKAILKARSPACGKGKIYDGTFSKTLMDGNGAAAELLMKAGVEVIWDEE